MILWWIALKITIVGSGGAALTKERSCGSILVDGDTLVDCGCGSLKNLRILDANLEDIDTILLSHLHNDHVGDIASILWTMQIEGRKTPLKIYGPPGTSKFIGQILHLVHTPKDFFGFGFSAVDLMDNSESYGFKWCNGKHVPRSNAYRIDRDGSFCISGDTRPLHSIARLAEDVDLLIHDSSFTKSESDAAARTNHSTSYEAGEIAHRAGATTLILFYLLGHGSEYEKQLLLEASEQCTGTVAVGRDFLTLET